MLYLVPAQQGISLVHVADNDCNVLEPAIVAARVDRDRTTFRRQIFSEFDELVAEPHSYHANSQSEHTFEMLIVLAGDFGVRYLFECEHFGIKIHRPVHVGDSDSDRVYAVNQSGALLGQCLLGEDLGNSQYQRHHPDC